MPWIVALDDLPRTNEIARVLCARCDGLRLVDVPDHRELAGVVVCRSGSGKLYRVLEEAVEYGTQVIVVVTDDAPEPWSVLAAGAADLVLWTGDPCQVSARLERLDEVERLVVSPTVTGLIRGSVRLGTHPAARRDRDRQGARRARRPLGGAASGDTLVVVDCTTIVPTLSGSELFGHERGAFTGALSMRNRCAASRPVADGGRPNTSATTSVA